MGYVSLTDAKGHVVFHFDREIIIFLVLTVTLLATTFGIWLWVEWRHRRRYVQRAPQHGQEEYSLEKQ